MHYLWQHIQTITATYTGSVPLTHYLRNHCKLHKSLGSRDRRIISAAVYSWYRCAKGITNAKAKELGESELKQVIFQCLHLCNAYTKECERLFAGTTYAVTSEFNEQALLPHAMPLSEGIEMQKWLLSMQQQPQLFIRIRNKKDKILSLLTKSEIPYSFVTANCLALPNGSAIDTLLPPDSFVVQDASSQQTGTFFRPQAGEQWYDCCAGAGGKSLLLMDICPKVKLTVSDKRKSILSNLQERFRLYGHILPEIYVSDMQSAIESVPQKKYDAIICDVPCSGSGTWSRTPEQMYFFEENTQQRFPQLQQTIAQNAARYLKDGGKLYYITCSVFREENEDVVAELTKNTSLKVTKMQLINGIEQRADSMFIAVLQ